MKYFAKILALCSAYVFCLCQCARCQCATDSLTYGSGAPNFPEVAALQDVPCFPEADCQPCDSGFIAAIPDTTGYYSILGDSGESVRIQIWDGCHLLLLDSCHVFRFDWNTGLPVAPVAGVFPFAPEMTFKICADPAANVSIYFKPFPVHLPVDTLLDSDTLCGSTGLDVRRTEAVDGGIYDIHGRKVETLQSGVLYVQNKRKFIISK